jgi:hypothetical protein
MNPNPMADIAKMIKAADLDFKTYPSQVVGRLDAPPAAGACSSGPLPVLSFSFSLSNLLSIIIVFFLNEFLLDEF